MVGEHGFKREELRRWFDAAERKESILEAIARPAEKRLTWGEYRKIFITPARVDGGIAFWRDNAAVLARAADTYGVAPEVVVAIIGVETRYGDNMGSYRVIDALATLAFDYPPRGDFFAREQEQFWRSRAPTPARWAWGSSYRAASAPTRSISTATRVPISGRAGPTRSAASRTTSAGTDGSTVPRSWCLRARSDRSRRSA